MKKRAEKDVLGKIDVDENAYYGSFTQRARENFQLSGIKADSEFIKSLAMIKKAAAMAYAEKAGDIYGAACAAKTAGEKEEANRLYSLALVRSLKENDFYGVAIIARDSEFHFADKIAGIEYRNQISKGNFEAAGDFAASYGRKDWAIDAYKQAISYTRGLEYVIVEGKLNEIARLSLKLANLTRAAS